MPCAFFQGWQQSYKLEISIGHDHHELVVVHRLQKRDEYVHGVEFKGTAAREKFQVLHLRVIWSPALGIHANPSWVWIHRWPYWAIIRPVAWYHTCRALQGVEDVIGSDLLLEGAPEKIVERLSVSLRQFGQSKSGIFWYCVTIQNPVFRRLTLVSNNAGS